MNYSKSIINGKIPFYLTRLSLLFLLVLWQGTTAMSQDPVRIDGGVLLPTSTPQIVPANGHTYKDFTIPTDAGGKYLYLHARGGDGGYAHLTGGVFKPNADYYGKGGQGAHAGGTFRIGTGANEIPPGSTLRFIVGAHGQSKYVDGGSAKLAGGGGGGTGVLFLPPSKSIHTAQAEDWVILAVAGGGGGGFANGAGKHDDGLPGNSGPDGTYTHYTNEMDNPDGTLFSENYGRKRRGGKSLGGMAGGGTSTEISSLRDESYDHYDHTYGDADFDQAKTGGFQMFRENGQTYVRPVGGYYLYPTNNGQYGGFGFGSGGYSQGHTGVITDTPGGGGGYSGGMGGDSYPYGSFSRGGGGGGSFANTTYALPGTAYTRKNGVTTNSQHGEVRCQLTTIAPVSLSFFDHAKPSGTNEVLLQSGNSKLRWQGDGNLVLHDGFTARWATYTNGKGATECTFQGDGNLVIYAGSQAIWATGTDAGHHDGKGGRKLLLTPSGHLSIVDADNQVMWSTY